MNLLILMSDEHTRRMTGCYGHPLVQTPNLDRLAERGVRFDNAYVNHPICVPSRANFITGRYTHETGNWDNAHPYTGHEAEGFGHRLTDAGHRPPPSANSTTATSTTPTAFSTHASP